MFLLYINQLASCFTMIDTYIILGRVGWSNKLYKLEHFSQVNVMVTSKLMCTSIRFIDIHLHITFSQCFYSELELR